MKFPNLKDSNQAITYQPSLAAEKKLWKKGYRYVVGLDESGRGSLAGPVVAAAVMINPKFQILNSKQNFKFQISNSKLLRFGKLKFRISFRISDLGFGISKLKDSKKLSSRAREKFYKILTAHPGIWWGLGRVSEKVIDKINILEATKRAMKKAIKNLLFKTRRRVKKIDFLILDGNFKLDLPTPQKTIVKGDEKVFSCALASIIAKVTRDRILERYAKKYPQYGFDKHKGYPTKYHLKMLKKYGPSVIHRLTYKPVSIIKKMKL